MNDLPAPRITILGFTVPDELLADAGIPLTVAPQTRNFAASLQSALLAAGAEVSLISTFPVQNYPAEGRLAWRSQEFLSDQVVGQQLGFINIVFLKHLSRFISCMISGRRHMRMFHTDILLIHGVHSPFLWFARLVKARTGVTVIPILTDPPGVILESDRAIIKLMKRIDARAIRKSIRGMDGVVSLTKELGADLAPTLPKLVMEGILSPTFTQLQLGAPPVREPFVIAYAGGLTNRYGVQSLVEAVQAFPGTNISLKVCGSGPLQEWVSRVSRDDPRVEYLGVLPIAGVIEVYRSAHLLINPRPITEDFVRYSFPSKMIEYMSTGRPVLTTRLPGIPEEYKPFVWFTTGDSTASLRAAVEHLVATPESTLNDRAREAQAFVQSRTSPNAQGTRIVHFARTLLSRDPADRLRIPPNT